MSRVANIVRTQEADEPQERGRFPRNSSLDGRAPLNLFTKYDTRGTVQDIVGRLLGLGGGMDHELVVVAKLLE